MKVLKFSVVLLAVVMIMSGCSSDSQAGPNDPTNADQAVSKAIDFLRKAQNEDGSFGKDRPGVGITGLCVYGMATSSQKEQAKDVIDKGVAYLLENQRENGSINNHERMLAIYRTSIAIMALDAVDPVMFKNVIAKAQNYLKSAQFDQDNGGYKEEDWQYGGWNYAKESDEADPDLSNVQFALSALKESGLSEDDPAYKRAVVFLNRCQNRSESNDMETAGNDGGGFYAPQESKAGVVQRPDQVEMYKSYGSMTYALLKSFIFCGIPKDDPRVQAAYDWIAKNYTVEENPGMGQMGLFYYYMTMARALNALGVDTITTPDGRKHDWRQDLTEKIISKQSADGSWINKQDRWMESDPTLVTGYALTVLNHCRPATKKQ